jgi:putative serine protease PepD
VAITSRDNADPAALGDRSTARSPWWSDALADPWRDPDSAAVISGPAPESVPPPVPPEPPGPVRFSPRTLVALSLAAGMLAGLLGAGVGYVASVGRRQTVVLGAGTSVPAPLVPGSLADEVTRVMPSVVTVTASTGMAQSIGSGFVIGKDGYIITNEHVVYGADDSSVTVTMSDGTTAAATVIGRDPESDIAVLRSSRTGLSPVFIGDSDSVGAGDSVFAIGTPLALAGTVTAGIVSAVDRTIEADDVGVSRYYAAIQTDAAINRGNSGGPLFDHAGRVIGINSVIKSVVADGGASGNIGIAFAIPINQAMRLAAQIIQSGKTHRTVIGADFDTYTGPGGGVRITTVDSAGPAAAVGLRPGDVVTRIGSHPVAEPVDLIAMVRRYDPGTTVSITYQRGGASQVVNVVLAQDTN